MEIEDDLHKKLNELAMFFSSVKESESLMHIDRETASNGLNKVELIRNIVHNTKKSLGTFSYGKFMVAYFRWREVWNSLSTRKQTKITSKAAKASTSWLIN